MTRECGERCSHMPLIEAQIMNCFLHEKQFSKPLKYSYSLTQ